MSATCEINNSLAPVLRNGEWLDIGYETAIKMEGGKLLHRQGKRVTVRELTWLTEEMPLLNWILKNS